MTKHETTTPAPAHDANDARGSTHAASAQPANPAATKTIDEVEREHVARVLRACRGHRSDAAKVLGIDRKTLYRKLARWQLAPAEVGDRTDP